MRDGSNRTVRAAGGRTPTDAYVVDDVKEASVIDVDDPRISTPIWVISSHAADD
jgi:hypothetical protein